MHVDMDIDDRHTNGRHRVGDSNRTTLIKNKSGGGRWGVMLEGHVQHQWWRMRY